LKHYLTTDILITVLIDIPELESDLSFSRELKQLSFTAGF